jgi:hypothetical protein
LQQNCLSWMLWRSGSGPPGASVAIKRMNSTAFGRGRLILESLPDAVLQRRRHEPAAGQHPHQRHDPLGWLARARRDQAMGLVAAPNAPFRTRLAVIGVESGRRRSRGRVKGMGGPDAPALLHHQGLTSRHHRGQGAGGAAQLREGVRCGGTVREPVCVHRTLGVGAPRRRGEEPPAWRHAAGGGGLGVQGALRSGCGLVSSSQEKMLPSHPTDANGLGIVRNVGCIGVITPSSRA